MNRAIKYQSCTWDCWSYAPSVGRYIFKQILKQRQALKLKKTTYFPVREEYIAVRSAVRGSSYCVNR